MSFDRVADIYDKTRGPPQHVVEQLNKVLAHELCGYGTILDVGVGTGRFAKPMQDEGLEVVGVDIAEQMMKKAVERGVHNLIRGDARFLPFKDNSFEAAVCVHVLHLISEWKTALREICRVTQKVMVSMIYAKENPLKDAEDSLLRKYGFERRRVGEGEWELKDLVKPSKNVFVASFSTSADEHLEYSSQRVYSHQWEIPEAVNNMVVDELRRQFSGRTFPQELRILLWNINDLKTYCRNV
jgi:ubiquinone/menaquinone biosynthesis C-methylase UbiE